MVQSMAAPPFRGRNGPAGLQSESRASRASASVSACGASARPRSRPPSPLGARRPRGAGKELLENVRPDRVALGHDVGAMDDVAELADVPGPAHRPRALAAPPAPMPSRPPSPAPRCGGGSARRAARCRRGAPPAAAERSERRSGGSRDPRAACPAGSPPRGSRLVAETSRTSTRRSWVPADAPHGLGLEDAQQLDLELRAHLGDLVEEAASRRWPPRSSRCGACRRPVKAPRSCPNSSLSIRVGEIAPQLNATNGARRAARETMDRARDDFLARAALHR